MVQQALSDAIVIRQRQWRLNSLTVSPQLPQARDHGRQRSAGTGGSFGAEPLTMDEMAVMVPGLDAAHFRRLQTDRRLAEQQTQPEPARELVGVAAGSTRSSWRREVHGRTELESCLAKHPDPDERVELKLCFPPVNCCHVGPGRRPRLRIETTIMVMDRLASMTFSHLVRGESIYMSTMRATLAAGPQRGGVAVAPDAGEGAAAGPTAVRGATGAWRPRPPPPAVPDVRTASCHASRRRACSDANGPTAFGPSALCCNGRFK